MSSETFFARFEAGQPGDETDLLRWAMSRWRLPEDAVALAYAPRWLVAAAGSPLSLKLRPDDLLELRL